jgi:RHS repeat-associated protein
MDGMTPQQRHHHDPGKRTKTEHITRRPKTTRQPLALVADPLFPDDLTYVHADHLGQPQKMTDATQAIVWDRVTRPFGETESLTGAATNNQRFPGQYADSESGYAYNYFRDYDPALGRYLQSDPIGLAGGMNTYAYVGGNPVMRVDPTGEFAPLVIVPLMIFGEGAAEMFLGLGTAGALHAFLGGGVMTVPDDRAMYGLDDDHVVAGNGVCEAIGGLPDLAMAGGGDDDDTPSRPDVSGTSGGSPGDLEPDDDPDLNDLNKLSHIFGNPRHNLGGVVQEQGGQQQALRAIRAAAEGPARAQVGQNGVYTVDVPVGSYNVTVRGIILQGELRIGSAWVP